MKNIIKAIALSLGLMVSAPLFAQDYHITIAPPALQVETIPDQTMTGAVWQPGYYRYDPALQNYTFVSGQWVMPPGSGASWVSPSYELQNGEYIFIPGRWVGTNGQILTTPRKDDDEEDARERNERRLNKDLEH